MLLHLQFYIIESGLGELSHPPPRIMKVLEIRDYRILADEVGAHVRGGDVGVFDVALAFLGEKEEATEK